jgi:hypothetical protein
MLPFQPSISTSFDFTSLSAKHPDVTVVKLEPTLLSFPLAIQKSVRHNPEQRAI